MTAKKYLFPLLIVLIVSVAARLYCFFDYHLIWWDAAVYLGMGKYMFSLGQVGLWEPLRPIVWPIILGIMWFAKLNALRLGMLMQILMSLAIIYLIYDVSSLIFSERTGIIASAIFSFSSIFFFMEFHLYTEIPATFFLLLALSLLIRKRFALAGTFWGIAILTKFTILIFAIPFLVFFAWDRRIRAVSQFCIGSAFALVPFFIFNLFMYKSVMLPFFEATRAISQVVGCNYLDYEPWYFYFYLLLKENLLYVLFPVGVIFSLRKVGKEKLLIVSCLAAPLFYFSQLHCRDYRYLITFLPFVAIYTGLAIDRLLVRLKRCFFLLLVFAILGLSLVQAISYYEKNEQKAPNAIAEKYYHFLENRSFKGEVWSSNPIVGIYANKKLNLISYPVYTANLTISITNYLTLHSKNISYVFMDTCGGGIICSPSDGECARKSDILFGVLKKEFLLAYKANQSNCFYYIFATQD